jgi:hypothetical protein
MLTRRSLIFGASGAALAAPAGAGDASATAFITEIYNSYKGDGAKGMPLDTERAIRRYFEPKLATLMANDRKQAASRNEVGSLDFDPFLDAQDWDVTAFEIVVSDEAAGKAQATVKFTNQGQAMTVVLDLVQVKNAWAHLRHYLVAGRPDGDAQKDFCSLRHVAARSGVLRS